MITEEQRKRYRENQKNFRLRLKTEQGQREYQAKKFANRMKNEYKGFKFACDGITTSIEVNLPFRCMTFIERQKRVDMKKYNEIQTNLKKMVGSVYQKSHIVVVEPEYAQIVLLGNDENEVRNIMNQFLQWGIEKTNEFGVYTKNCKKLNNWFDSKLLK